MNRKRKTEIYKVIIEEKQAIENQENYKIEELKKEIILNDFLDYFYTSNKYDKEKDNKILIKSKNLCYFIEDCDVVNEIRKVKMKYIRFNKKTKVVNINTMVPSYEKSKDEGDEEKQHYVMKTQKKSNKAVLIWEKITGAMTISMLEKNINSSYRKWVKTLSEDKNYLLQYNVRFYAVSSPQFINELKELDKISLLKVTIDNEKLTDDEEVRFSDGHLTRDTVDVIYKPLQRKSFTKKSVIKYFELFETPKGKTKINRIVIQGRKEGNAISLDTDGMKLSEYINTNIDEDGQIDTDDLFNKYVNLINKNFKSYFDDMFIDIKNDELEE